MTDLSMDEVEAGIGETFELNADKPSIGVQGQVERELAQDKERYEAGGYVSTAATSGMPREDIERQAAMDVKEGFVYFNKEFYEWIHGQWAAVTDDQVNSKLGLAAHRVGQHIDPKHHASAREYLKLTVRAGVDNPDILKEAHRAGNFHLDTGEPIGGVAFVDPDDIGGGAVTGMGDDGKAFHTPVTRKAFIRAVVPYNLLPPTVSRGDADSGTPMMDAFLAASTGDDPETTLLIWELLGRDSRATAAYRR